MTRDEFRQAVREMQREGTALTMANLMVRTELPRAQIEAWLDDMQRDPRSAVPPPPMPPPAEPKPARPAAKLSVEGLAERMKMFRSELASDLLKRRMGLGRRPTTGPRRMVRVGGVAGLVFPPAGLAYAAPWPAVVLGAVGYVALAFVATLIPFLGIPYLLVPAHIAGGFFGAAYAWRFNHGGKRVSLLPGGSNDDAK